MDFLHHLFAESWISCGLPLALYPRWALCPVLW